MTDEYRKGILIVALGAFLFAPDSLLLRLMAMDQWPTVFWRGLIGGGTITICVLLVYGRRYPAMIRALGLRGPLFMAAFSATTFLFVLAVRETTVANTLFIVSTSPIFSSLISWIWLKEPPDRRTMRTILLALIGVGLIAGGHHVTGAARQGAWLGDLAALGAALTLALSFNITRRVRPVSMVPLMGPAGLLSASIASLFVADFTLPDHAIWPLMAMGLVIMPVATWCLTIGPRYIPAPEVSLLMLIEAVFGPLIVWWALSEYPGNMTLIGGTIVLGAIAWSSAERLSARRTG